MEVTPKLIAYLEVLANFSLSDEEKGIVANDLQDVLTYMESLNALDTENIEPLVHAFPAENVFRSDSRNPISTPRENLLKNAPDEHNGYFRVPKTIE